MADAPFVPSSGKPVVRYFAKPDHPGIARLSRLEGTVIVHVPAGPAGSVIDAVVVQREMPVKAWLAPPYRFSLQP